MLNAVRLINKAKAATEQSSKSSLLVDLHPNRPDYRGVMAMVPVSLESDPTFEEIEKAGALVQKHDEAHTVLDDMFLISGEIPRVTAYEKGLQRGIRFNKQTEKWEDDTLILDERFVACRLKDKGLVVFTGCSHAGVVNASRNAVQLGEGAPLYCVIGGFHLADAEKEQIDETVEDLEKLQPKVLMPGHCTGMR
jgi:7,8-dihydropterin-6-yl-methyl-4-(beta-D-ribofuranosyl)aminobenzene 5'-phosphate synthase